LKTLYEISKKHDSKNLELLCLWNSKEQTNKPQTSAHYTAPNVVYKNVIYSHQDGEISMFINVVFFS